MEQLKQHILERQEHLTPLVKTAGNPKIKWKIKGMLELIDDLLAEIKSIEKSLDRRD